MSASAPSCLEWHVAFRPAEGQSRCGDQHAVHERPQGVLLALADGLGHGEAAETAATTVLEALTKVIDAPLDTMFKSTHEAARRTRGAALTLVDIDRVEQQITWAGVGNVQALLLGTRGKRERALLRGGVVGYRLPPVKLRTVRVQPGDLLILTTDGIRSWPDELWLQQAGDSVASIATHLLETYSRSNDDATALVGRYRGEDVS